jgi:phytoene dehydrogenase-like protein
MMYDAIVIGGGHNGLVTAARVAKAGFRVLVLERRETLGGAAATEELFPGWKVSTGAHDAGLFRPEVFEALDLAEHGLEFIENPVVAFVPQLAGPGLTLWRDPQKSQADIERFSPADAERFPAFITEVGYITNLLDGLMTRTPPNLTEADLAMIIPWFGAAFGLEQLSHREFTDFFRVLALSTSEFLDEWFESDLLKGLLGTAGIMGTMQGPKAPYTALTMLYHYLGNDPTGFRSSRFVKGGVGQLSAALAGAARRHGAEIRTGVEVTGIVVDGGQASGVFLQGGEVIPARTIISNADPRRTFFELVGAVHLEVRFVRQVKNIRYRGCTAKVNLALSDLPRFSGQPDDESYLGGHIMISPSLEYLERAYDEAKYGRFSSRPYLDIVVPTVLDPSLAPAGRHLMSITMQYAPYHLRGTTWADQREALGDMVIETLAEYAPTLKELILQRQVLTPLDWEREYGLTEGGIYHGQITPDQMLFMRPVAGSSQYRSPIRNLYLCGAGTHPGGGVTGAPGYNAAREVLQDLPRLSSPD